jgi:hypothetical protein
LETVTLRSEEPAAVVSELEEELLVSEEAALSFVSDVAEDSVADVSEADDSVAEVSDSLAFDSSVLSLAAGVVLSDGGVKTSFCAQPAILASIDIASKALTTDLNFPIFILPMTCSAQSGLQFFPLPNSII